MTIAVEQETVTFYHSAGQRADGGQYPSSMQVRISGGERTMSRDGARVIMPTKMAQFHNGVFQTSDPETIAELRRLAKGDSSITESYEAYASRVLTKDQQIRRQGHKQEEVLAENSRLKQKIAELEGKGKGRGNREMSE